MAKFKTIDYDIFDITIDPEFKDILPESSEADKKQLEENILTDGEIRDPYIVWEDPQTGTFLLIDGHHRLQIMKDHPEIKLPYVVKEAGFENRWEAIAWILANCIGRRNLSDVQQKRIIARYNDTIKQMHGNNAERGADGKYLKAQGGTSGETQSARERTAEVFNVGKTTVGRAIDLSNAIDEGEEISPGFAKDVESGEIKASQEMISNISKVPEEHRSEYVGALEGIRKENDASENQKSRKEAQNIYNRYTKEAVDKATESLEGYDNDIFENTGNGNEEESEKPANISDIRIREEGETAEPISAEDFAKAVRLAIDNMDKAIEIHLGANRETAKSKKARKLAVRELKHGHEVIDKYIDMLQKEE